MQVLRGPRAHAEDLLNVLLADGAQLAQGVRLGPRPAPRVVERAALLALHQLLRALLRPRLAARLAHQGLAAGGAVPLPLRDGLERRLEAVHMPGMVAGVAQQHAVLLGPRHTVAHLHHPDRAARVRALEPFSNQM
eukprot:405216-Pyramimonas_sp.AAC.2